MGYIHQAYADFFHGLSENNHKEWFHGHKKDYESQVKAPFLKLLDALIPELIELEPEISPEPKDALFRINRDIRFSKDKRPYNTIMKAGFSPGGKKSLLPGFYLGIDAESIHVGGGLFNVKGPELKAVRSAIAGDPEAFVALVEGAEFKERLGELKGEKITRIGKEFKEAAEKCPYILHKQFYAMARIPLAPHFGSDKLVEALLPYFKAISPMNQFLKNAFSQHTI